jgi:hypothetical protein
MDFFKNKDSSTSYNSSNTIMPTSYGQKWLIPTDLVVLDD